MGTAGESKSCAYGVRLEQQLLGVIALLALGDEKVAYRHPPREGAGVSGTRSRHSVAHGGVHGPTPTPAPLAQR